MLQSAHKQKRDAGLSVESITGNITSTMLHLFILPIRVFFLSHFVVWFRKTPDKIDGNLRPATAMETV
jgi:hypothetical protein